MYNIISHLLLLNTCKQGSEITKFPQKGFYETFQHFRLNVEDVGIQAMSVNKGKTATRKNNISNILRLIIVIKPKKSSDYLVLYFI